METYFSSKQEEKLFVKNIFKYKNDPIFFVMLQLTA